MKEIARTCKKIIVDVNIFSIAMVKKINNFDKMKKTWKTTKLRGLTFSNSNL